MLWDSKVIWVELLVGGEKGGYELEDKRRLTCPALTADIRLI